MRARLALLLVCVAAATPAAARNLCDLRDPAEVLAAVSGEWVAEEAVSLENATTSLMRRPAPAVETITAEGDLASAFLDGLTGGALPLTLADSAPYDVDRVDDALETTESAAFADILSDTRCGPERLPQLVASVPEADGIGAQGTVTLVAYFDDRMLRITEMTLRSEGAVLFMVATALLTRND